MIEKDTSKFKIQNQSALLRISQGASDVFEGKEFLKGFFFLTLNFSRDRN